MCIALIATDTATIALFILPFALSSFAATTILVSLGCTGAVRKTQNFEKRAAVYLAILFYLLEDRTHKKQHCSTTTPEPRSLVDYGPNGCVYVQSRTDIEELLLGAQSFACFPRDADAQGDPCRPSISHGPSTRACSKAPRPTATATRDEIRRLEEEIRELKRPQELRRAKKTARIQWQAAMAWQQAARLLDLVFGADGIIAAVHAGFLPHGDHRGASPLLEVPLGARGVRATCLPTPRGARQQRRAAGKLRDLVFDAAVVAAVHAGFLKHRDSITAASSSPLRARRARARGCTCARPGRDASRLRRR